MTDSTSLNRSDNQIRNNEPDSLIPEKDIAEEAAEQFARLFLEQCVYNKHHDEKKTQ